MSREFTISDRSTLSTLQNICKYILYQEKYFELLVNDLLFCRTESVPSSLLRSLSLINLELLSSSNHDSVPSLSLGIYLPFSTSIILCTSSMTTMGILLFCLMNNLIPSVIIVLMVVSVRPSGIKNSLKYR